MKLEKDYKKKLQAKLFEMLKEIDRICRENDIEYYLIYGTAIGAVRHKGFIPWDDDLDIAMTDENYFKFLKICEEKLDKNKYFVQTLETEKNYFLSFAKVRDITTTYINKGYENIDITHGVYIDIFPLVGVPKNKIKRFFLKVNRAFMLSANVNIINNKILKTIFQIILKIFGKKKVLAYSTKNCFKYKCKDCDTWVSICDGDGFELNEVEKKVMGKPKYVKFENTKLPIPQDHDTYLKKIYGDYMKIPSEEQIKSKEHTPYFLDLNLPYAEYKKKGLIKMIKVSVIVPVYNVEKYIDKCLNSLVNQTLKEIEIIVVNDGSPDNSQEIIDEYVKKYPKKVKSFIKENGGQGSARNLGMNKACGEYISFVDSDDWLNEDALEKMYKKAKKENSDIVICDMIDHYIEKDIYHNCTKYNSVYEVTPSACNKIFKKTIIEDIEFLPKLWYEDYNFTTKVLFNTDKISTISEGFYNCNCGHISTMNNNNSNKNLDILVVTDDIIKYAKENDKYDRNTISHLIFNHILISTVDRVSVQKNKDKKKVITKIIKYCKDNIKDYQKQPFYKSINKKRKIIAWLNYHNLWYLSMIILKVKKAIK